MYVFISLLCYIRVGFNFFFVQLTIQVISLCFDFFLRSQLTLLIGNMYFSLSSQISLFYMAYTYNQRCVYNT